MQTRSMLLKRKFFSPVLKNSINNIQTPPPIDNDNNDNDNNDTKDKDDTNKDDTQDISEQNDGNNDEQDCKKPNKNKKRKPKVIFNGPEDGRQPTTKPVIPIAAKTTIFNTPSPKVRPNTTAALEIGRDLKRSINPFCISAANPTAVAARVKATVCTNIPGISNCTYPPG